MNFKPKNFKLEKSNRIQKLILNRPKNLNVFNLDTLNEFRSVLMQLAKDDSINVLILKSSHDKVFTAGADINDYEIANHKD